MELAAASADIVIHALGGGFGHVTRACSLAKELDDAGRHAVVFLPARRADVAERFTVRALPFVERASARALRRDVDAALSALSPSHLVVDALPAGVLGELRELPSGLRRTLLLRAHRGIDSASTRAFDDVIDLEAHLAWRPHGVMASPFPPVARRVTGSAPPAPATSATVDVALLAGDDERLRGFFERLAVRLRSRGIDVVTAGGGPAGRRDVAAAQARVIVGAGGYNLVYEAAAAGVWHVAIPLARAYDDQRRRALAMAEVASDPLDVERRVLARLDQARTRPRVVELATFQDLAQRVLAGAR